MRAKLRSFWIKEERDPAACLETVYVSLYVSLICCLICVPIRSHASLYVSLHVTLYVSLHVSLYASLHVRLYYLCLISERM